MLKGYERRGGRVCSHFPLRSLWCWMSRWTRRWRTRWTRRWTGRWTRRWRRRWTRMTIKLFSFPMAVPSAPICGGENCKLARIVGNRKLWKLLRIVENRKLGRIKKRKRWSRLLFLVRAPSRWFAGDLRGRFPFVVILISEKVAQCPVSE